MTINNLSDLKEFCKANHRICPQPKLWNELWNKLQNKKQVGAGWSPPLPLILAAWWNTSILSKQIRLMEHLDWANDQGQLNEITNFLTNLTEEEWYHSND
jgi:hypothetical protein